MVVDVASHKILRLVYGEFRDSGILQDQLALCLAVNCNQDNCLELQTPEAKNLTKEEYATLGVILDVLVGARLLLWENPDDPRYFPALLAPL
jgi:hypothetical protein